MQHRFECTYAGCVKSYCSSFNLKRHVESTHMGIKKFMCDVCGKQLSSKQNYVDHKNLHTGDKPYVCEYPGCDYQFRQLSQYFIHKQMHDRVNSLTQISSRPPDSILTLLGNRLSEKEKDLDIILIEKAKNRTEDQVKSNGLEIVSSLNNQAI